MEAALALPIVLIALLLIVQVGIVVRDALALGQAAREGARAAAIEPDDEAAEQAVRDAAGPLNADAIEIVIDPPDVERSRGEPVRVALRYVVRIRIPIVSTLVRDLTLTSESSMRAESEVATPTPVPSPTPTP